MITIEDKKVSVDLRNLSHSKDLKDLWKSETDAFKYGLWYPRMSTYLINAHIKKKNPKLYKELSDIMSDTIKYNEEMIRLEKDYVGDDKDVSIVGIANYILDNIKLDNEDDRIKVAFILGIVALSKISEINKNN